MGFGKIFKRAAVAVATGGLSEAANLATGGKIDKMLNKDKLFGEKDKGTPGYFIGLDKSLKATTEEARAQQLRRMKELDRGDGTVESGSFRRRKEAEMMRRAKGRQEDREAIARRYRAQRGLQGSSIGLSSALQGEQERQREMAAIRGKALDLEARKRQQVEAQKLGRLGAVNRVLMAPGQQRTHVQGRAATGRRSGGIGNILLAGGGAALGGMAGGPQGAAAGMQMGQGFGQMM